jgi:pilus assembly protein CpaB
MGSEGQQASLTKDRRRRRNAALGIALIAVAVVAAVAAASLLTRYMDRRISEARVPTEKVAVARVDIPVAIPITAEWVELVDWPSAARPAGAVSDLAAVVGRVAIVPIGKGEAVLPGKLVDAGARRGLATLLEPGSRAVAVRVDDVVGVAGFLHPGDRVDVIVTMKPRDEAPFVSKIILQDVKVLAVGKDLAQRTKDAEKATPATVATVMVSPEESERLALAATKGQLLLALRGIGDDEQLVTTGIVPAVLLAAALPAPAPAVVVRAAVTRHAPRPAPVVAPPAPPPEKRVVEILRGDLYEKRDFAPKEKRP